MQGGKETIVNTRRTRTWWGIKLVRPCQPVVSDELIRLNARLFNGYWTLQT